MATAVISAPPSRRWTLVGLRSEAHLEAHLLEPADFLDLVGLVGLGGLGCPRSQAAPPLNHPLIPYSEAQTARTARIIQKIIDCKPRTLLVVDDGAYFLQALAYLNNKFINVVDHFDPRRGAISVCIVEQTTRGHLHLNNPALAHLLHELKAPVVSIARSLTNTKLEAPFIGKAIIRAIRQVYDPSTRIKNRRKPTRTALLGLGVVGQATLKSLKNLISAEYIDVIDCDNSKKHVAKELMVNWLPRLPSPRMTPGAYDLVIGCTGYPSFEIHHRGLLGDGALLISGSSGAVEFNRTHFVAAATQSTSQHVGLISPKDTKAMHDREMINGAIHAPLAFSAHVGNRCNGKTYCFTMANAGCPINFTGEVECLPVPLIQCTHALLYAACFQTIRMLNHGEARTCDLNDDDDVFRFLEGVKLIDLEEGWK